MKDRKKIKLSTFMDICCSLSELSHDNSYKVASLIITDDFREICSIGYNGDYKGGPNERINFEHGKSGFLHSEENALIHLNKPLELRSKLILLCTHKPCTMCAKRIVNSGIKKIVYKNDYKDSFDNTDEIFESSNIFCKKIDDLLSDNEKIEDLLKM